MDSLEGAFDFDTPVDYYIPEDGICEGCDRLKRNHPGVAKVLALKGYEYFDPIRGGMVYKVGIPYCTCETP